MKKIKLGKKSIYVISEQERIDIKYACFDAELFMGYLKRSMETDSTYKEIPENLKAAWKHRIKKLSGIMESLSNVTSLFWS